MCDVLTYFSDRYFEYLKWNHHQVKVNNTIFRHESFQFLHPNAPNVSFFPTIFLGVHPCKVFSVFFITMHSHACILGSVLPWPEPLLTKLMLYGVTRYQWVKCFMSWDDSQGMLLPFMRILWEFINLWSRYFWNALCCHSKSNNWIRSHFCTRAELSGHVQSCELIGSVKLGFEQKK